MSVKAEQFALENHASGEFVSLEEKVYRTIELLKNAREAKAAAERDMARMREELETREEELDEVKQQVIVLKKEREEVRVRVEKMLEQMDALVAESE